LAYTYLTNLSNQITALQSQCTEKDKEIERQTNLKTEYKEMYQNAAKSNRGTKSREMEILKGLLDQQCITQKQGKPYYKGDSEHYDGRMDTTQLKGGTHENKNPPQNCDGRNWILDSKTQFNTKIKFLFIWRI
jgi:hypothetical protein